jgi:hypothetical protein
MRSDGFMGHPFDRWTLDLNSRRIGNAPPSSGTGQSDPVGDIGILTLRLTPKAAIAMQFPRSHVPLAEAPGISNKLGS